MNIMGQDVKYFLFLLLRGLNGAPGRSANNYLDTGRFILLNKTFLKK